MKQSASFSLKRKLLALAVTQAVCVSAAQAELITVNDAGDSDGPNCTLRAAIESANTDTAVNGCSAGFSDDTIVFDSSIIPGTITLGGTQLTISASTTIEGPGADQLTIDANGASRHFLIDDGSTSTFTVFIEQIKLVGGTAAGGAFPNNVGGSILNFGRLTLNASTLSGNSAEDGGALDNRSEATITNSTFTGNSAVSNGGALTHSGAILTLFNSTLSRNGAGRYGGGAFADGPLTIENSTIVANLSPRGAVSVNSVSLINSIVANPSSGADCSGTDISTRNTLIEDGSCDANLSGNPLLGPLANNGGPTLTHALLTGSPAIGVGANCLPYDQRGVARVGGCDIGGYHFRGLDSADIVVNTLADTTADDGACSLREAIASANTDRISGVQTDECAAGLREDDIVFDPALALPGAITLGGTQLGIYSSLTIHGPGADELTIDAGGSSRHFSLFAPFGPRNEVTLDQLTLTGGVSGSGGAILNQATLTLANSTLTGNSAGTRGGGIASNGQVNLSNSILMDNSAGAVGGGIYLYDFSEANLSNSTLTGNSANDDGGGIYVGMYGAANLNNSALTDNSAGYYGGGIFVRRAAEANVSHSALTGNRVDLGSGGAICVGDYGEANLSYSMLTDNSARYGGGGILVRRAAEANVSRSTLTGNRTGYGGGGGILVRSAGEANVSHSTLTSNRAGYGGGGGILVRSAAEANLSFSTLMGNVAGFDGGGIFNSGQATLSNSTLTGNGANYDGGGIGNSGQINLINSTLTGNRAGYDGGGISNGGQAILTNSLIANSLAGGDCYEVGSTTTTTINSSLIEDDSCYTTLSGDPMLGPLQDNGGPTLTHALLPGSPVIDLGDKTSCLTIDQTGMPRPIDGDSDGNAACDIGAFEFVDIFGPVAALIAAPNVTTPGGTYQLSITYTDDAPIDVDSIDRGDISVTPMLVVEGTVRGLGTDNTVVQIDYLLMPPGGQWDASDNGTYTINLNADQVFDQSVNGPNAAPAGELGTFTVNVPNSTPQTMDTSFSIAAESTNGTEVGQVTATDIDGNIPATGAWQITAGNGSGAYAIDDDGTITVADATILSDAVLTVEVTDTGGLSDTAMVTVNLLADALFADGFERL